MKDFVGTKIALINNDKVLSILRDNKPGINFPGMWNLPGGQREADESPLEVATREIKEELGINLNRNDVLWQGYFPAVANPAETASFMVFKIDHDLINSIVFGEEGQRWKFMTFDEFLDHPNVVWGMKDRLRSYLASVKDENR